MRRSNFTLVEVMISLTLMTLLLSCLFSWYRSMVSSKAELSHAKVPVMEEHYFTKRVQEMLTKSTLQKGAEEDITLFYHEIESNALVFTFDNGPCRQPLLSNLVMGKLYLDREKDLLCLGLWPLANRGKAPSFTFVLLDQVTKLSFEYYYPPDHFRFEVDPDATLQPSPKEGWQNEWLKKYEKLPALVRVNVERNACDKSYLFDLGAPIILPCEVL